MSTALLNNLLEKTEHYDKDERYMATSDLCTELSKDVRLDENMERRICTAVLKQLDDQSNNVQSVAVRCLGILLKKVHDNQIGEICEKLCNLILEGQAALRDIYSMGLKTLITDVPDEMGALVSSRLAGRLLRGISTSQNDDIKRECLDRLSDLLRRFGHLVSMEHDNIMTAVIKQLENPKSPIRRRAAACLASLAVVSSDTLLNRLVETILAQINTTKTADKTILVQTIGNIIRTVGFRLGRYLDRLIPIFLKFCGNPDDESQQNDAANELRENCFPGLESFVLRCPREVASHLPSILDTATRFLSYDPNYSYEDENEDMNVDNNEDQETYDDDDNGGSEDDDGSWKVRKAAVRVIQAIVIAKPERFPELYLTIFESLLKRFKEREENVRVDIFACFTNLLSSCVVSHSRQVQLQRRTSYDLDPIHITGTLGGSSQQQSQRSEVLPGIAIRADEIVAAVKPHWSPSASVKTKAAVFSLLRELVTVLRGGLDKHLPLLFSVVQKSITDRSQNQTLRLDALQLLRLLLELHSPDTVRPSVPLLLPLLLSGIRDDWVKVVVESLRGVSAVIAVLRPLAAGQGASDLLMDLGNTDSTMLSHVTAIYEAIKPKLLALDIDQEIKEGSIVTTGKLLYHLGDYLGGNVPDILAVLLKRLESDATRMASLRTFAIIAASPLPLDMSTVLPQISVNLAGFLKQQSRALKQASLKTLDALISGNSLQLNEQLVTNVLREASNLISDADLHLASLALRVVLTIVDNMPGSINIVNQETLPRIIALASSSLLQGYAQAILIQILQRLVTSNVQGFTFHGLLEALLSKAVADHQLPRQSIANLSKCIAGICVKSDISTRDEIVQRFATYISDPVQSNSSLQHLSLLCIGELGQEVDLAHATNLQSLIQACFESDQEEVKSAAAFALGHIALGSVSVFLPVIIEGLGSHRHPYLYLQALREIIVVHANTDHDLSSAFDLALPGLLAYCRVEEEGVRSMVAECLGAMTCMDARMVNVLEELVTSSNKYAKWTVATALKYSLSHPAHPQALSGPGALENFLRILFEESDLEVRRATLLMVNAGIHYTVSALRFYLQSFVMPKVLAALKFKQERVVDLGPFKHRVDDGLPLRKVALTCVETILEVAPECVDVSELLREMGALLEDKPEVKVQCYQVLGKLCIVVKEAVLEFVDTFIDHIDKEFSKRAAVLAAAENNQSSGGGDADAHDRSLEILRSALRTVLMVSELEGVDSNRRWVEFLERASRPDRGGTILEALRQERVSEHT